MIHGYFLEFVSPIQKFLCTQFVCYVFLFIYHCEITEAQDQHLRRWNQNFDRYFCSFVVDHSKPPLAFVRFNFIVKITFLKHDYVML